MQLEDALLTRRSLSQLAAPVPSPEQLAAAFMAAGRAPDHRLLRPWRYLVIADDGLSRLGELFVASVAASDPARADAEAAKLRQMPQRAPMIVVAILSPQEHPTVPDWEQWLSLGASVQNFLLMLHDQGFAGMWRTGEMATSAVVRDGLGVQAHEHIAGFIYVGTARMDKAAPASPAPFWQAWP